MGKRVDKMSSQSNLEDIVSVIMKQQSNWCGHIIRSKDGWCFKKERGRPGLRWDDGIRRVCGGGTWTRVAYVIKEWARMPQDITSVKVT